MVYRNKVVLATGNPGKLREFRALLGDTGLLVAQSELGVTPVEETGETFAQNALLKARHAAAETGLAAIADDSGLEVDALNGAPGVRSARYAGGSADDAANNKKLLSALEGIPPLQRTARFRCVIVFVRHADDPDPVYSEGTWEGFIAGAPQGLEGFGYDPVFVDGESGLTSAQLSPEIKNSRSHRGHAIRGLADRVDLGKS